MESTTEKTYTKADFSISLKLFDDISRDYNELSEAAGEAWAEGYYRGKSDAYMMAAHFIRSDLAGNE